LSSLQLINIKKVEEEMKFIFNKPEQFAYTLKIHTIQSP